MVDAVEVVEVVEAGVEVEVRVEVEVGWRWRWGAGVEVEAEGGCEEGMRRRLRDVPHRQPVRNQLVRTVASHNAFLGGVGEHDHLADGSIRRELLLSSATAARILG